MKPHKWLEEIKHFLGGGDVEYSIIVGVADGEDVEMTWALLDRHVSLDIFGDGGLEFRIKSLKKEMRVALFRQTSGCLSFLTEEQAENQVYPPNQLSEWHTFKYKEIT